MKPEKIHTNKNCLFSIIMAYITAGLLVLLNLYIAYNIIISFMGDGFSFLGGMFIGMSYAITVPANIFSIILASQIKTNSKKAATFFQVIGILTALIGLILHNATIIWPAISVFGFLLFLSAIICIKSKKKSL